MQSYVPVATIIALFAVFVKCTRKVPCCTGSLPLGVSCAEGPITIKRRRHLVQNSGLRSLRPLLQLRIACRIGRCTMRRSVGRGKVSCVCTASLCISASKRHVAANPDITEWLISPGCAKRNGVHSGAVGIQADRCRAQVLELYSVHVFIAKKMRLFCWAHVSDNRSAISINHVKVRAY